MKEQRFFVIGAIIVLLILACILGARVMSAIRWAESYSQPTIVIEPTATAPAPALNLSTLEAVLWTPTPPPDYHATLEALIGETSIP